MAALFFFFSVCVPICLSRSQQPQKHMAPARADCCLPATLQRRDWLKLGHSHALSAFYWPKIGHSLRPQVSPCHCRVTAGLEGETRGEGAGCVD